MSAGHRHRQLCRPWCLGLIAACADVTWVGSGEKEGESFHVCFSATQCWRGTVAEQGSAWSASKFIICLQGQISELREYKKKADCDKYTGCWYQLTGKRLQRWRNKCWDKGEVIDNDSDNGGNTANVASTLPGPRESKLYAKHVHAWKLQVISSMQERCKQRSCLWRYMTTTGRGQVECSKWRELSSFWDV